MSAPASCRRIEVADDLGTQSTNTAEPFPAVPDDDRAERPSPVELREVTKTFAVSRRWLDRSLDNHGKLHALRGVSLRVEHGESVALVGESGSGKSTLLRVIAGLEKATSGSVRLQDGERPADGVPGRGRVADTVAVGRRAHRRTAADVPDVAGASAATRSPRSSNGSDCPPDIAKSRAGQLSGGQRQRVSLARATVVPPSVLLCDEPTSALDVSLAASVLNLIGDLRRSLNMSVVFVTHDLSVARVVADRIAVMYLGRIVEIGPAEQVIGDPAHPYTQALVDSIPDLGRESRVLPGEPASPLSPPDGCAFHPRCPIVVDTCSGAELDVRLEGHPGQPAPGGVYRTAGGLMAIAIPAAPLVRGRERTTAVAAAVPCRWCQLDRASRW